MSTRYVIDFNLQLFWSQRASMCPQAASTGSRDLQRLNCELKCIKRITKRSKDRVRNRMKKRAKRTVNMDSDGRRTQLK